MRRRSDKRLRAEDVAAVRHTGADDLEPVAATAAPNRRNYLGLAALRD